MFRTRLEQLLGEKRTLPPPEAKSRAVLKRASTHQLRPLSLRLQLQSMPTLLLLQKLTEFALALQQNLEYYGRCSRLAEYYDNNLANKPVSLLAELEQSICFFKSRPHWLGAEQQLSSLRRLQGKAIQYHKKRMIQAINAELNQFAQDRRFLIRKQLSKSIVSYSEFRGTVQYFMGRKEDNPSFNEIVLEYYFEERTNSLHALALESLRAGKSRLQGLQQTQRNKRQEFQFIRQLLSGSRSIVDLLISKLKHKLNSVECKSILQLQTGEVAALLSLTDDKTIVEFCQKEIKTRLAEWHVGAPGSLAQIMGVVLPGVMKAGSQQEAFLQNLIELAESRISQFTSKIVNKTDSFLFFLQHSFALRNSLETALQEGFGSLAIRSLDTRVRSTESQAKKDLTFIISKPIVQSLGRSDLTASELQINYGVFKQNFEKFGAYLESKGQVGIRTAQLIGKACWEVLSQFMIHSAKVLSEEDFQLLKFDSKDFFDKPH